MSAAVFAVLVFRWFSDAIAGSLSILKIALVCLLSVNSLLPLLGDYKEQGKLTRWGKFAFGMGVIAATLAAGLAWTEARVQQLTTARSIDHQTSVILGLKRLLFPLDEQIRVDVVFTIPADQAPLQQLTRLLDQHIARRGNRVVRLTQITSEKDSERALTYFLHSAGERILYICQSSSCMDTFPYQNKTAQIGVIAQLDCAIGAPQVPDGVPHWIVLNLEQHSVVYNSTKRSYVVGLSRCRPSIGQMTEVEITTDDLCETFLYVPTIGTDLKYRLDRVAIFRKNGRQLVASNFAERKLTNHMDVKHDTYFHVANFAKRWAP